MTHQIDFSAHETIPIWNAHWTYSDLTWCVIRGRKPFFLNRVPYAGHVENMRAASFEVAGAIRIVTEGGLPHQLLSRRYRALDDDSLRVRSGLILTRKPG